MTKADLIDDVARKTELSRKDSEVIVDTIFEGIVKSLRGGDKIEIRGFGSFRTRHRNSRVGRNPKTGERVDVPAKDIPYFKPSKELKDLVNSTQEAAQPVPEGPPAAFHRTAISAATLRGLRSLSMRPPPCRRASR